MKIYLFFFCLRMLIFLFMFSGASSTDIICFTFFLFLSYCKKQWFMCVLRPQVQCVTFRCCMFLLYTGGGVLLYFPNLTQVSFFFFKSGLNGFEEKNL